MNDLVASYLILSGECPLAGIGKLFISNSNAVADLASKEILPPQYKFQFKEIKNPDTDGLLRYLSKSLGCPMDEASQKMNAWLEDVKAQLAHHIDYELPFIGSLVKENNGHVHLKQSDSLNVLKPVFAERVVHTADSHEMIVGDKLSNTSEMNQLLNGKDVKLADRWWLPAAIIFAAAVLFIILYFLTNGFGMHLHPANAPATYSLK